MNASSLLLKNCTLIAHAHADAQPDSWLRVDDGKITSFGSGTPPDLSADHTVIDAEGRILMPGWIHTHLHLCQTIFRGIAEDLPLLPWLKGYIWPMEAAHTPESLRVSARLSIAELLRTGCIGFMSMETVHHTDAVMDEVIQSGLYGCVCHCLMDEQAGVEALAVPVTDGLQMCDQLIEQSKDCSRVEPGVGPRFVLSCTEENMIQAADYAREKGLKIHTHASEQTEEVELVRERTGRRNIHYLHDIGLSGPDVCLAHCVHTDDHERGLLKETQTRVLHCPSANMKLSSGIAPIPEYLEMGIPVSIGADGTPCNNRFDMFLEMREAALMQKLRLGPDHLSARRVVQLATEDGAKALQWDNQLGTIEPGKSASFILLDPDSVHVLPSLDIPTNLVYAHEPADVWMTVVDGEILYRNGEYTRLDLESLKADAVSERLGLERRSGLRSD